MLGFIAIVLLFKHNRVVHRFLTELQTKLVQIKLITATMILLLYILIFCVNGIMFFLLLNELDGTVNYSMLVPVIGIYTCSWLIGFVTPGAPAGIGIREVFLVTLLTSITDEALIITTVVIFRIVSILGDVLGFSIAAISYKLVGK